MNIKRKKGMVLKRSTGRFESHREERRRRGSAGVTQQLLSTELFLYLHVSLWPIGPVNPAKKEEEEE